MLWDTKLHLGDKVTIIKNKQSQLEDLMVHREIQKLQLIWFILLEMREDLQSRNL